MLLTRVWKAEESVWLRVPGRLSVDLGCPNASQASHPAVPLRTRSRPFWLSLHVVMEQEKGADAVSVSAFSLDCRTNALLGLPLRSSPFLLSSLQLLCMDSVAGFRWEVKHVLG